MRLCLNFVLFFLLVLTNSNAHGLTGKLAQESYQGVIQNLRGGVNTFGFQPNIGQLGQPNFQHKTLVETHIIKEQTQEVMMSSF